MQAIQTFQSAAWTAKEKNWTILEEIKSGTIKSSNQKILNSRCNVHLGFAWAFFFCFGGFCGSEGGVAHAKTAKNRNAYESCF